MLLLQTTYFHYLLTNLFYYLFENYKAKKTVDLF